MKGHEDSLSWPMRVIRAFGPRTHGATGFAGGGSSGPQKPPWPPPAKGWPKFGCGTFVLFLLPQSVFVPFVVIISG